MNFETYEDEPHPEFKVRGFYADWLEEGKTGVFRFEDEPFVVTGTARLATDGYLVEYWVSGLSWSDYHDDFEKTPRLLLKTTLGIKQKRNSNELEKTLLEVWNYQLFGLAMLAANEGQMVRLDSSVPENPETSFHAQWQLMGHHRLGTFDAGMQSNPTTVRTARQYELLKSMGYTRPQKAILEFENKVLQTELMLSALEGRLNTARNKKLVLMKEDAESTRDFFLENQDWVDLR
jgi:hypothetical protein